MDYLEEEANAMILLQNQNRNYALTNLRNINRAERESEAVKIFKFFTVNNLSEYYNIQPENPEDYLNSNGNMSNNNYNKNSNFNSEVEERRQNKIKKKEKIESYLRDSAERAEVLIEFLSNLTKSNSIFGFRMLRDFFVNQTERAENYQVNYLKKKDFFHKSIQIFKNKTQKIRENKEVSQLIFSELTAFKALGFLVEDDYKLGEIKENITTNLIFKTCNNYENIFSKKKIEEKFLLNLIYENSNNTLKADITGKKKFLLKFNFCDAFNKKYQLEFFLVVKLQERKVAFNITMVIEDWIKSNFSDIKREGYELINYIIFIYKYLFYKMMKIEIKKINENLLSNIFEYKNLSLFLNEENRRLSINASYHDMLETEILAFKLAKNNAKNFNMSNQNYSPNDANIYKEIENYFAKEDKLELVTLINPELDKEKDRLSHIFSGTAIPNNGLNNLNSYASQNPSNLNLQDFGSAININNTNNLLTRNSSFTNSSQNNINNSTITNQVANNSNINNYFASNNVNINNSLSNSNNNNLNTFSNYFASQQGNINQAQAAVYPHPYSMINNTNINSLNTHLGQISRMQQQTSYINNYNYNNDYSNSNINTSMPTFYQKSNEANNNSNDYSSRNFSNNNINTKQISSNAYFTLSNKANIYANNINNCKFNFINKQKNNNRINDEEQTKSSVTSNDEGQCNLNYNNNNNNNNAINPNSSCINDNFLINTNLIINLTHGILNELKLFKPIKEFYYSVFARRENNPLAIKTDKNKIKEIFDNSIFCFNIQKFSQNLMQKFVIFKLENLLEKKPFTFTKTVNFNYLTGNFSYKYHINNHSLNLKNKNLEINLTFQKSKINFEFSTIRKLPIFIFEKDSNQEIYNKKIDFTLLFDKIEKFLESNKL